MIDGEGSARTYVASLADGQAMKRLDCLIEHLRAENERQNLVSRESLDNVWQRHIADSAQLLTLVSRETSPWLDLGSGAGFPGLVIAALRPDLPITLVEARRRRVEWLERMVSALNLSECTVVGRKLEALESFPVRVIVARAFAPLEKLLRLSHRFSTSRTVWLLPKGRSAAQELEMADTSRYLFHVEQSVTDADSGILVGKRKAKHS